MSLELKYILLKLENFINMQKNKNIENDDILSDQKNSSKINKKEKEEIGGPNGLEPTRYGDWEVKGRVSDF